jgi:hypothetical protein
LRTDAPLDSPTNGKTTTVAKLRWRGANKQFPTVAEKIGNPRLVERLRAWERGHPAR